MPKPTIRTAVICADSSTRESLRRLLANPELGVAVELQIGDPLGAIGDAQLTALRQTRPDLVVLDLSEDAELGLRFAQFLTRSLPDLRLIVTGPGLDAGLLVSAMRGGASDYLPKPVSPDQLREALDRISERLGRGNGDRPPGQVYSLFSPKGGGGATTLATNLAIVLHRLTGKSTLLVDLDLELGESALMLGVTPRFNFIDFVENFRRMDAGLLASYIERHHSGVHLLSAPFQPERAEVVSADQVRKIVQFLRQHYEYIIIDTPRSFAPSNLAAFEQSDLVFVVTTVDLPSLRNIRRGLPLLRRVMARGNEQIRLVINRYSPGDAVVPAQVETSLGLPVFWKIANDYEAVINSINEGKPAVLEGKSVYVRDVKALGAQLAGLGVASKGAGLAHAVSAPLRKVWKRVVKRA
jgi:pilus assembly protein CpaE